MTKRFYSGKTYSHATGHSCAFRQWRADSHCNLIHGYALQFELKFGGELDERNWIVDFGGLKPLKNWLAEMFDHTYLVAEDDPEMKIFGDMQAAGMIQLRIIPATGAEKFSEYIFNKLNDFVQKETNNRVRVTKVKFMEHGKNAACYTE